MNGFPESFIKTILDHARRDYPAECCGVVLGPQSGESYSRVQPCRNLQDDYHAKDPAQFPRTSKNAYWMDPQELLKLQKQMRDAGEEIKVIYHSHVDAAAYFSEEDERMALSEGSPVYPKAVYLVVSVLKGNPQEFCFYRWDASAKKYLKAE